VTGLSAPALIPPPVPSRPMDRITIIGCGGSGKTYLANQLAALLDLPVTHLDSVYYDTNWTRCRRRSSPRCSAAWSPRPAGAGLLLLRRCPPTHSAY
jgi:hypothetical protein